ncbi:MAG: lipid kinase [Bacteroidaceae bacterium]|nr:lipid kinase [Bacteroidaceae bacterium]
MQQDRWGIVYCPKPGVRRTHKRWEHIKELLDAQDIAYDFVQSENAESVLRLTKMLVDNDYKTIVIVGGDSALNRALNGLLTFDDDVRQQIALGVIPNGRGNDFASFWGFDEHNDEETIAWLKARRIRKVDVGVLHYQDQGETRHHYFFNCLNVGLVANIMKIKFKTRRIFGLTTLTYFASMIVLLFQRMETKMKIRINEETINRKVMSVCVGNSKAYGLTPNAVPYNGMLDVSIIAYPEVRQLIEGLRMLFTGKFLSHKSVRSYRTPRKIQFFDIRKASVSTDGIVLTDVHAPFKVGLIQEHINLIIPSSLSPFG